MEQLGPYKIDRLLGRGGMGAVYMAVHEETGETAAVKTLAASLAADPGFRDRFDGEIESLKKLRHPNIVTTHDIVSGTQASFIVMELVDGRDLQSLLQERGTLGLEETLDVIGQVAAALEGLSS